MFDEIIKKNRSFPSDPLLRKIYIEPTSECNLRCRTCVRNSWQEINGTMTMHTFEKLERNLKDIESLKAVSFWGIGEPLMHPQITTMIKSVKSLGLQAEIITNGTLLNTDVCKSLVASRLDTLILSIDGVSPEYHAEVRSGANLNRLIKNIKFLNHYKTAKHQTTPKIGIEFVVSKRNISQLPGIAQLARLLDACFVIISNIMPYTEDFKDDILYWLSASNISDQSIKNQQCPKVILPNIDKRPEYEKSVMDLLMNMASEGISPISHKNARGHCPFVQKGSLSVRWDGDVSPCIPLMHSYKCYVLGREKTIRRYCIGNIVEEPIWDIWRKSDFRSFRERVSAFDFPPCIHCDCDMAEANEEDCFGNPFPTCGDCLWAHSMVICP